MNPDDITLKKAANKDHEAFEQIVLMYQSRLYALCLRMMGNEYDALDAAQETFIKIYQNLPGYRKIASFSTWAYRIAANTCVDMLRRRKKAAVSFDALEEEGAAPVQYGQSAESEVVRRAASQELARAIDLLPEDQRVVIVLRDVHGLSYGEIAGMLSLNINTVKSRISRGRQSLRQAILSSDDSELFSSLSV